jgi:hypothetical protein
MVFEVGGAGVPHVRFILYTLCCSFSSLPLQVMMGSTDPLTQQLPVSQQASCLDATVSFGCKEVFSCRLMGVAHLLHAVFWPAILVGFSLCCVLLRGCRQLSRFPFSYLLGRFVSICS